MALLYKAGEKIAGAYDRIGVIGKAIADNMIGGYGNSNKQKELKRQLMSSVKQTRNILVYSNYDSDGNFIGNGAPNRISDEQFNKLLRLLIRTANVKSFPISSKMLFRSVPVAINTGGGIGPVGPAGSILTRVIVDTTAAPIVMDAGGLSEVIFVGSNSIGSPKTWNLINASTTLLIPSMKFTLTTLDIQTFPSNFRMSDARWNAGAHTWTPLDTGTYEFSLSYDETNWTMTCIGGPYT